MRRRVEVPIAAYVDASLLYRERAGLGISLQDWRGEVLAVRRPVQPAKANELELRGIHDALAVALQLGVRCITVHCDCVHVVCQVLGLWTWRGDLALLADTQRLLSRFEVAGVVAIPRHANERAHDLAREALGLKHERRTGRFARA